ncbi:MAG: PD-(D/E)XK nuclease superfamily protein [Anaerolineae bacterium]
MPGRRQAPKSGNELKQRVVALGEKLGLRAETEVYAARRLWGQRRYIDVVLTHEPSGKKLGIECKFQATSGHCGRENTSYDSGYSALADTGNCGNRG